MAKKQTVTAPAWPPSPEEERRWKTQDLIAELRTAHGESVNSPYIRPLRRKLVEDLIAYLEEQHTRL